MKSKKTPGSKNGKAAAKPAPKAAAKPAPKAAAKPAKKSGKAPAEKSSVKKSPLKKTVKSSAKKSVKSSAKTSVKAVEKKAPAKKSARTLRPKVFEQASVGREFGFPAEAPGLPESYGRDRLVLMTQDPDYLFSYWEVTPAQLAASESQKRGNQEYQEAIKLNWAARSLFERNFVMLPVSLDSRRWYLRVPFPGLSYQVEIGWLGSRGHFISILESNESDSPESWDMTRIRLKDAGEVLAYTTRISKPAGSSQPATIDETIFTFKDWNPDSLSSSPGGKRKKTRPSAR